MRCSSCGTESRPFFVRASGARCWPCEQRFKAAAPASGRRVGFRWAFNVRGDLASCYAVGGERLGLVSDYVGCIRYEPGNWLARLLRPNRWYARAGFNVGRFRFMGDAQLFVEHHAGGA